MVKHLKSDLSRGFSLIEVMIVMAIGSILILGLTQMTSFQARISKTAELDKQLDDIKRQFQTWIFNQSACDATFAGLRYGDAPDGIRRSLALNDYIIRTGDRIPASDWTVDSFTLLSRNEILQRYPQYGAGVNEEGLGTGVLQVVLRQLARGTTNTQVATTGDTGAFKSVRKELYFPIQAKFGDYVHLTVVNPSPDDLKSTAGPPSGVCCPSCTIPGTAQTYTARANQLLATPPYTPPSVALSPGGPPNPFYLRSTADSPASAPSPQPTRISGYDYDYYEVDCWMYNIDLAIVSCVSPSGGSL